MSCMVSCFKSFCCLQNSVHPDEEAFSNSGSENSIPSRSSKTLKKLSPKAEATSQDQVNNAASTVLKPNLNSSQAVEKPAHQYTANNASDAARKHHHVRSEVHSWEQKMVIKVHPVEECFSIRGEGEEKARIMRLIKITDEGVVLAPLQSNEQIIIAKSVWDSFLQKQ